MLPRRLFVFPFFYPCAPMSRLPFREPADFVTNPRRNPGAKSKTRPGLGGPFPLEHLTRMQACTRPSTLAPRLVLSKVDMHNVPTRVSGTSSRRMRPTNSQRRPRTLTPRVRPRFCLPCPRPRRASPSLLSLSPLLGSRPVASRACRRPSRTLEHQVQRRSLDDSSARTSPIFPTAHLREHVCCKRPSARRAAPFAMSLAAQRRPEASTIMGSLLLRGYAMLAESCPHCMVRLTDGLCFQMLRARRGELGNAGLAGTVSAG